MAVGLCAAVVVVPLFAAVAVAAVSDAAAGAGVGEASPDTVVEAAAGAVMDAAAPDEKAAADERAPNASANSLSATVLIPPSYEPSVRAPSPVSSTPVVAADPPPPVSIHRIRYPRMEFLPKARPWIILVAAILPWFGKGHEA